MAFARALAAALFAASVFANVLATSAASRKLSGSSYHHDRAVRARRPTDAIARIIQDPMQRALGQPIVIENIGGAGGMIAATKAARADPDGYTILIHQVALAAGMSMYSGLTFDAEKDFTTIGLINTAASTLAGRPTMPANNFEELVGLDEGARAGLKIGHPGVGSYGHLAGVLVAQELGVRATQIAYRGAGPALVDLLGDQVDLESQSAVVSGPLVKAGKLKAYAIIGRKRFPACRTCRPWANSATGSSISISGTCCWCRPARRGRSSTRST